MQPQYSYPPNVVQQQASYAPVFMAPQGGQQYYVVQQPNQPQPSFLPQPTVQYVMQQQPAVPPAQPMFVSYQQPQQQQQPVQYVLAMPAPSPMFTTAMPPMAAPVKAPASYSVGLPQMAMFDMRAPPPYPSPAKSIAESDPSRSMVSNSLDSQDLSLDTIVCRHYLEGKCNRRKCRFRHTQEPPSAPGSEAPPKPASPALLATTVVTTTTTTVPTTATVGTTTDLEPADQVPSDESTVAALLSRLHLNDKDDEESPQENETN